MKADFLPMAAREGIMLGMRPNRALVATNAVDADIHHKVKLNSSHQTNALLMPSF
jgi:hypothetical protein